MKKIAIWGETIPYNSSESKLEVMEIKGRPNPLLQMLRLVLAFKKKEYADKKAVIDTYTYVGSICRGREKETYEDVPYLVPFLVKGSDKAVIVIPGGGFAYKQSDVDGEGKQSEGDLVAKELNKAGISAFVLWYRSNPYYMPVPLLDLQRAIRYVRFHADEFEINPERIGLIGFSAGGYQVAAQINLVRGKDMFPEGYEKDETDKVDDSVKAAAFGYPLLSFLYNPTLMFAAFPGEKVRDERQREQLNQQYDCMEQINSADVPQFVTYGTKDSLLACEHTERYIEKVRVRGGDITYVPIEGADHGYGANPKQMRKCGPWIVEFTQWCNRHL